MKDGALKEEKAQPRLLQAGPHLPAFLLLRKRTKRSFYLAKSKTIALSLKGSAKASLRRKAAPFQSAMSMLNFYINRAGKNLPARRKKILNQAKQELRQLFSCKM